MLPLVPTLPVPDLPRLQIFIMGSDNHRRRWLHPTLYVANRSRCVLKLLMLVVGAVYTARMLSNLPLPIILEKPETRLSIVDVQAVIQQERDDRCKHDAYNINSTCGHGHCYAIVLTVNMGFYDFFLNWYHFYNQSVLQSINTQNEVLLLVIAEDNEIYDELNRLQLGKAKIIRSSNKMQNSGRAENYESVGYKSLVSGRAAHLLSVLCGLKYQPTTNQSSSFGSNGWIVLYSDIDTVWLQNPLPFIEANISDPQQHLKYDILAAVDDHDFGGVETYYCTGFLAIANTLVSFYFLSQWDDELKTNPQLNQPIFNTMLQTDDKHPVQIRHAGLDEGLFPPGRLFFDDENKSKVLQESVVVHNNYIIGRENKKRRFKEYGLWKTST
ncbi:hypothetical protein ACHAXN_003966 [Cyclotella atomus]